VPEDRSKIQLSKQFYNLGNRQNPRQQFYTLKHPIIRNLQTLTRQLLFFCVITAFNAFLSVIQKYLDSIRKKYFHNGERTDARYKLNSNRNITVWT
jgi:DNA-binding IclR family transcriptional regulator